MSPPPNLAQAIDLQVNGYAGVDFNSDDLSPDDLHGVCQRLKADGVAGILATIITDTMERMSARLARLAKLRALDPLAQVVVLGFHIEGPFISGETGYVGAHPAAAASPASVEKMERLLEAADGLARVVTLAPERDPKCQVIRTLAQHGVCVSAGHCNPTLDQLDAAIDAGLTMFTHLGNGCPLQMHRHDNVVQRVLSRSERLWISLIADGVHVPWPALRNYIKLVGCDRAIVVTDAISAAGMPPGNFRIGEQSVVVDEQGATWSADRSHLVGSSATMLRIRGNLARELGHSDDEIEMLTSTNPRRAIGIALDR
jgi:N-acetylglucosamine-6-phosphate deacetylase